MSGTAKLLLTGAPGVGKTTLIRRVASRFDGIVRGFYTEEIRVEGSRVGFRLVDLGTDTGEGRLIAHVDLPKSSRVSKYGVDVDAVDEAVEATLGGGDVDLWVVDEIGKMECHSESFVRRMRELLGGDDPVLATVARRGGGFIAEAKSGPDVDVWEVTRKNRNLLPDRILDALGGC